MKDNLFHQFKFKESVPEIFPLTANKYFITKKYDEAE